MREYICNIIFNVIKIHISIKQVLIILIRYKIMRVIVVGSFQKLIQDF